MSKPTAYRRSYCTAFTAFVLCFITVSVVVPAVSVYAAEAIRWQRGFGEAVEEAQKSGKLLIVHFYGDQCLPCRKMDREVFTRPDVAAAVGRSYVIVKVDSEREYELAQKLRVKKIPCDVILTPTGQVVDRREGEIVAERYIEYLNIVSASVSRSALAPINSGQVRANPPSPTPPPAFPASVPADTTQANQPPQLSQVPQSPFPSAQPAPPVATVPVPPIPVTATLSPTNNIACTSPDAPVLPAISGISADPNVPVPVVAETAPKVASLAGPEPAAVILGPPNEIRKETNSDGPAATGTAAGPPTTYPLNIDTPVATVEVPLGLDGYCPVSLTLEERWVSGNPMYFTLFRGRIYRLSTEEALEQFQREPARYAPIAGGDDIVLMVDRNRKVSGLRKFGAWYRDRVYLFSCAETFDAFSARPDYYSEIAEKYETALRTHFDKVQR